jgi:hypothetical protein
MNIYNTTTYNESKGTNNANKTTGGNSAILITTINVNDLKGRDYPTTLNFKNQLGAVTGNPF